jgi:hypothetical protein
MAAHCVVGEFTGFCRKAEMTSAIFRLAATVCVVVLAASQLQDDDGEPWELWPGPVPGECFQTWYANWTTWAENTRKQANLTGDIFTVPQLLWTQVCSEYLQTVEKEIVQCSTYCCRVRIVSSSDIVHSGANASVRLVLL